MLGRQGIPFAIYMATKGNIHGYVDVLDQSQIHARPADGCKLDFMECETSVDGIAVD
jgi:hypothetical protein